MKQILEGIRNTLKPSDEKEELFKVLDTKPIAAWPWPRVVAGVLQERAMSHSDDVFYNFWAIAQQGLPVIPMPYGRTDVTRNKMAIQLLRSDHTHLLMLDIDHKHPWDIVQRLARWVLADKEIKVVGGINFRRSAPFEPCAGYWGNDDLWYPPTEWKPGLLKVDMLGTGSILIAREVFELIPPPWFYNDYSMAWKDIWPGEDIMFSKLCNEYGIDLYVDTTTTSPHLADSLIGEGTFKQHLENAGIKSEPIAKFREKHGKQT